MNLQPAPRLAWGMWKRFLLGGVLIVVLAAAATATAGLLEVRTVADALKAGGKLKLGHAITAAEAGSPQTILILGSDIRIDDIKAGRKGRSDTMMLVRLDPEKHATAMLSIPRDLKVPIRLPNGAIQTDKMNAAYALGGPKLTVQTIKNVLGVEINHVINVAFRGFRAAVNRVGCVYIDVDRRYFNNNSGPGPRYAVIDIKPGYQKICGQDALDYVRFRHEDSDLVRAARQQEFLAQAKQQVGVKHLFADRKALVKILGRYSQTDIRGTKQVLRLIKLVVFSAGHPVREVKFRSYLGSERGISYVFATPGMIRQSVDEFLKSEDTPGPRGSLASTPAQRLAARKRKRRPEVAAGLENAERLGQDQAIASQPKLRFPVYYPKLRTRLAVYVDVPRVYTLRDTNGHLHHAYRMVLKKGIVGEYYGVQGTDWLDPPILDEPSEERRIGHRTYQLFYDGDRLATVAWRAKRAVYWVSNTLLRSLDNRQMLAIARSLRHLGH